MENFNFRRDLKYVDWKATVQVNVMRAAAAGFIVGTMVACMSAGDASVGSSPAWLMAMPLIYAVVLPVGLPVYGGMAMFCGFLSARGVPFVGLFAGAMSLMFALGDPPLFLLHRARPDLVPMDQPSFFSLRIVIFVLASAKAMQSPGPSIQELPQPPAAEPRLDMSVVAAATDAVPCPACGAANRASAKFCRQCGLALGDAAADQPADSVAAETEEAIRPAASGLRPWLAVAGAAVVIVAAAGGLWLSRAHPAGETPDVTVTTRSAHLVGGYGTLRVDVNVPAKATLDGWHLPDAGAQAASALVFSHVEATTHTLEVWSEGYRRESSSVVVKASQTSRISVDLQRTK